MGMSARRASGALQRPLERVDHGTLALHERLARGIQVHPLRAVDLGERRRAPRAAGGHSISKVPNVKADAVNPAPSPQKTTIFLPLLYAKVPSSAHCVSGGSTPSSSRNSR